MIILIIITSLLPPPNNVNINDIDNIGNYNTDTNNDNRRNIDDSSANNHDNYNNNKDNIITDNNYANNNNTYKLMTTIKMTISITTTLLDFRTNREKIEIAQYPRQIDRKPK